MSSKPLKSIASGLAVADARIRSSAGWRAASIIVEVARMGPYRNPRVLIWAPEAEAPAAFEAIASCKAGDHVRARGATTDAELRIGLLAVNFERCSGQAKGKKAQPGAS